MKRLQVLITLWLCIVTAISAQEITGNVVDEEHRAIEYANVMLLRASDSTFISGTVSGKNGEFRLAEPAEESVIRVSVVGYIPKTLPSAPSLGEVILQQDVKMLGTVMVKGNRSPYAMGKEGLITHVAETPLSLAGTVVDVFRYVPGMVLTSEGINVFGKGSPLVYVNGRQVRNLNELSRIDSRQLKDVEVIQNPGPEYPSDVRAIVKIRLLKPKGEGMGIGFVGTYARSENTDCSSLVDLSFNNKGLYAFGQYKWTHDEVLQKGDLEQTIHAEPLWQQKNELKNRVQNNNHDLTVGLDYTISKAHSLGFKYIVGFNACHHSDMLTGTRVTANGLPYDELSTHAWTGYDNRPTHQLNAYYNGMFGKALVNLNVDYLFNHDKNTQHSDETSAAYDSRKLTSISDVRNNLVAAKLILGHQLFKGMFKGGVEVIANNRHDDYTIDRTDILSNSASRLKETQISPFLEYQYGLPFGMLNAGVRFEHVSFKYYEDGLYMPLQSRNFNNMFPSLSLMAKLGKVRLNIGYSVKTKRPTYRQLSNNVIYINRFSMQSGNPSLSSEHVHDVTAAAEWKYVQAMVSWQDERDAIIYWAEQMSGNTSITKVKYKNLNSIKSLTVMLAAAPSLGFWNPRLAVGVRKQWLALNTMMGTFNMDKPVLNVQWANILRLPGKVMANVDVNYQSKGHYQNMYFTRNVFGLDVGLTKSFLKESIVLKIEGKDLFHLQKSGTLVYSNQMQLLQENTFDTRMVKVTLSYHFNASRSRYKGTGAGNSEKKRL